MAKTSEIIEIYDKIVRDENNEPIYCMTTIFNKQVDLTSIIVMPVVILQSRYYKIYYPIFYKHYTDFNLDILNNIRYDSPSVKNLPPHITTKCEKNIIFGSILHNSICLNDTDGNIDVFIDKSFVETPNGINFCQMEIEYSNHEDKNAYMFINQDDINSLCTVLIDKYYRGWYTFETTATMEYIGDVSALSTLNIALNEDMP